MEYDIPYCCYCGKQIIHPLRPTKEHLVPKSRGGNSSPSNKWDCCHKCNSWRSNKSLEAWKWEIETLLKRRRPRLPYYTLHDFEIMLENIDYVQHHVTTAGNRLKRSNGQ